MKRDNDNGSFIQSIVWNKEYSIDLIQRMITDSNIEIISFDVFDTLIQRPFFTPRDLFVLLEYEYLKLEKSGISLDFSLAREQSERIARQKSDGQEITLDEIYDQLRHIYGIDANITRILQEKENELEIELSDKRICISEIYKLASFLNKKIIIVSDMYLPQDTIEKILLKHDYIKYHMLYLSSTLKKTKYHGDMYKYILDDLKVDPEKILHIGDNPLADIKNCNQHRIQSFFIPKAIDAFLGSHYNLNHFCYYKFISHELKEHFGVRCTLAIIANKIFDNPYITTYKDSLFSGNPYYLGYFQLGILLFYFCRWLAKESQDNQINTLYFISRDGYMPQKIYDMIAPYLHGSAESKYLFASRSVIYRSFNTNIRNFAKLLTRHFYSDHISSLNPVYLSNLFSFSKKNQNKIQREIKSYSDKLTLIKSVEQLGESIFSENIRMNRIFKEYLQQEIPNKKSYFVDVGYARRSHMLLLSMIDKLEGGFFIQEDTFLTNKYDYTVNIKSFAEASVKEYSGIPAEELEFLISDYQNGTAVDFCRNKNDKIDAVCESQDESLDADVALELTHRGAIDFTKDFLKFFGNRLDAINSHNNFSTDLLEKAILNSREIDAVYFKYYVFNDNMTGSLDGYSNLFSRHRGGDNLPQNYVNDRWYRFGQLSRKRKLWVIAKVLSKKLRIYKLLRPLAKIIRKILRRKQV